MATEMICLVAGCPADGAPQRPEREERPDSVQQRVIFGETHKPVSGMLLGWWLPCGHYVQAATP